MLKKAVIKDRIKKLIKMILDNKYPECCAAHTRSQVLVTLSIANTRSLQTIMFICLYPYIIQTTVVEPMLSLQKNVIHIS